MTIKIGAKTLAIRTPADLDDRLVAMTGCTADEIRGQLREGGHPRHVATALYPFLGEDAPSVGELASLIANEDMNEVRGNVLALYEPAKTEKTEKGA